MWDDFKPLWAKANTNSENHPTSSSFLLSLGQGMHFLILAAVESHIETYEKVGFLHAGFSNEKHLERLQELTSKKPHQTIAMV